MTVLELFKMELEREAETTRKMLSRVPADKMDWQPHPKSMTLKSLTTHIADLPTWVHIILFEDGIDFETTPYNPPDLNSAEELLEYLNTNLIQAGEALDKAEQVDMHHPWTIRSGEIVYTENPRVYELRNAFSQVVHHRAQLGVCLRLLDIPIPGSYGPSADEQ